MTTKKIIAGLIFTVFFAGQIFGQNVGISESSTFTPNTSAMLHVESTNKGLLIPRVQLDDVTTTAPVTSPANGLMVFNATGSEMHGFYYWDGTANRWRALNHFKESGNGLIYNKGNTQIGINQVDTAFFVNGGVETTTTHGKNIVLRAGTTNSTANINGGNIILVPGKGSGSSGTDGKVEVNGELVTNAGFFQYRGEATAYDFANDLTMDNTWHEFSLDGIVPEGTKAIYVHMHYQTNALGATFDFSKSETTYTKIHINHSNTDWNSEQFIIPVSENNSIFYSINNSCSCITTLRGIIIGWWK